MLLTLLAAAFVVFCIGCGNTQQDADADADAAEACPVGTVEQAGECSNVDECAEIPSPCGEVPCTDLAPATDTDGRGFVCGPCPDGFEEDSGVCRDILECAVDNGSCGDPTYWCCLENEGAPPTCTDAPACDRPVTTGSAAAELCSKRYYECGTFHEDEVGEVDCGSCSDSGDFCVTNRCEPKCAPELAEGTTDDLVFHLMNQYSDEDISANALPVQIDDDRFPNWNIEQWAPRTDLTQKSLSTLLPSGTLATGATLSFRLLPSEADQDVHLAQLGDFELRQKGSTIEAVRDGVVISHDTALRQYDCNHVALTWDGSSVRLFVNGSEAITSGSSDVSPGHAVQLGRYPGQVWDIRVYARALDEASLDEVAGLCVQERIAAGLFSTEAEGAFSSYQCNVYSCSFLPPAAIDGTGVLPVTQENIDYALTTQNITYERNWLVAAMYPEGALCDHDFSHVYKPGPVGNMVDYPSWNNYLLDASQRRYAQSTWDEPAGGRWFHENFHHYQGARKHYLATSQPNWWMTEGSATWAQGFNSGLPARQEGSFVIQPHAPLYVNPNTPTPFSGDEIPVLGGHIYGSSIWFSYLARHATSPAFLGVMYAAYSDDGGGDHIAQMSTALAAGGHDPRELYIDFAARTATLDFANEEKLVDAHRNAVKEAVRLETTLCDGFVKGGPVDCDARFVDGLTVQGTGGAWKTVDPTYAPGNWAYNMIKMDAYSGTDYQVALRFGPSNPVDAEYRAMVVAYNETTGTRVYTPIDIATSAGVAQLGVENQVTVPSGDATQLFLVVAEVAKTGGDDPWVRHSYEYSIQPDCSSGCALPCATDADCDATFGACISGRCSCPDAARTQADGLVCIPKSCSLARVAGATTSGTMTVDSGNGLEAVSCDQSTDGGGWSLVLNYVHAAGTQPTTVAESVMPIQASDTLGDDESSIQASWGHLDNFGFRNLRASEIRFSGESSIQSPAHAIDFVTAEPNCIDYFGRGQGDCHAVGDDTSTRTMASHSPIADLPFASDGGWSDRGDRAMTDFPLQSAAPSRWSVGVGGGEYWDVDTFTSTDESALLDTIHRIHARSAMPSNCGDVVSQGHFLREGTYHVDPDGGGGASPHAVVCNESGQEVSSPYASCLDVFVGNVDAGSGPYYLDGDGAGGAAAALVSCDLSIRSCGPQGCASCSSDVECDGTYGGCLGGICQCPTGTRMQADGLSCLPLNCASARTLGATADGTITIDRGMGPEPAWCDQSTDGGGWTLVLNYVHAAFTQPVVVAESTLPIMESDDLGSDESGITASWGHANNETFGHLDASELRFSGRTSYFAPLRPIDFTTAEPVCVEYFGSGTGNCHGVGNHSTTRTLAGHSPDASLPFGQSGGTQNVGDDAMTNAPLIETGAQDARWIVGLPAGTFPARTWDVDNGYVQSGKTFAFDTIHRIHARSTMPASCTEVVDSGYYLDDRTFYVDTDGAGGASPHAVECNATGAPVGSPYASCADILAENPDAGSGSYFIDADGAGPQLAAIGTCNF